MINAIIIDDEKNNIANLKGLLERYCPTVTIVGTALNAANGKELIAATNPDLVFLDIQMPNGSGFDMLGSLPNYEFEIIFVTAHDQYGIQAIKFSALDYLLKPVKIEELGMAIRKMEQRLVRNKQNLQLQNLVQLLKHKQQREQHRLALRTARETRFVFTNQIIRCESSNVYTTFFLTNDEKIMVSRPIHEYEVLLKEYGFIRSHQSHLINRDFISGLSREDGGYLILLDGYRVPISRTKKDGIIKLLSSS